jgi:hypothetical protein
MTKIAIAKKSTLETAEYLIEQLAFERRSYEILDGAVEDFDNKMNEWCEKYYRYFAEMDMAGLTKYMLSKIAADAAGGDSDDGQRL